MGRSARRLLLLLAAALLAAPAAARGAEIELGILGGVQQTGGFETRDGDIELEAGPLYGISFGWRVRSDGILEVALWRQDSRATGDLRAGAVDLDVEIDTIELGGLWETRPGPMRPFLGLQVGATRFAGLDPDGGEGWDPSGGISGGVRWLLGEHAILRVEARATGILFPDGGAISCSGLPADCRTAADGTLLGAFSARASLAARF